ncbi:nitrogen regulation protein NR(I) [Oceanisphaera avium]|uniref:DNA-binding transcriptional regulator NtrC n=1 Tax=Oceanisphaera avium TaxID=1903694 RepID=A0A1Y0CYM9_9GAMM|nr:nitrogen regulation protein NR(I) [Oceanisphaera avium]ART80412.1 nitrogen regulation protein NR(I) [Oceanisphaera avium]
MTATVWIVEDDEGIRWVLERALAQAKLSCRSFSNIHDFLADWLPNSAPAQVVLCDIRLPDGDGLSLLSQLKQQCPELAVIMMTAHSDLDSAIKVYQKGAFEYLPKPFDIDHAIALVQKAIQASFSSTQAVSVSTTTQEHGRTIIGEAPAMQAVFRAIGKLANSSMAVLINGQSGTGKELVARALHQHSPRATRPFIALNMAAIPKDLIESELFGHEKGAFTGAHQRRQGRFEQAQGGTLFLDEIGDMPLDVQTRLLRVLAEGQFYRVGGQAIVQVNVRIIAATHQDLAVKLSSGEFREDLFHRLNVIPLLMPPLTERAQDIPELAAHFLNQAASELDVATKRLHPSTQAHLQRLPWPGNVRQLENLCRWLTVMAPAPEILISDLPQTLHTQPSSRQACAWQLHLQHWAEQEFSQGRQALLTEVLPEVEQILLTCALKHSQGHKQAAAKLLGWGRNTLTRKLNGKGDG